VIAELLLPAVALAWTPTGRDWSWLDETEVPFELHEDSFPAGLDPDDLRAAWLAAEQSWNEASALQWVHAGATTSASWVRDDRQVAQHHAEPASGGILAVANSWFSGDVLLDCDVRFYAANDRGPIEWSVDPAGAPSGAYDFERVAAHELGHCLGLGHSEQEGAIMFPSVSSGTDAADRALHDDDVAGAQALYGPPPEAAPPPPQDTDFDLLDDVDEADLGTDPLDPDTDDDGLLDGREITVGSDPLNPDTDGDGLSDNVEVLGGTDPLDPFDPNDPRFPDDPPEHPAPPPPAGRPEHPSPTLPPGGVGCSAVGGSPSLLALTLLLARQRRRPRVASTRPKRSTATPSA
jgi:hypothetical protein